MSPVRRASAATLTAVVWMLLCSLTAAVAQPDPGAPVDDVGPIDMELLREDLGEDRLSSGLELMELDGADYDAALAELWVARVDRDRARVTVDSTLVRLDALRIDLEATTRARATEKNRRTAVLAALDEVAEAKAEVAVAEFMGAGSEDDLGLRSLDRQLSAGAEALPVQSDLAWEVLTTRQQHLDAVLATTEEQISRLTTELAGLQTEWAENDATLEHERIVGFVRTSELPGLAEAVKTARWATTVRAVGQPLVVVDAYVSAARLVGADQPQCGVEWWMLAAVGAIESGHGTWGGSTVDADGNTNGAIIGLVLNGENGTAVIADSDGGVLDGDPVHDRAVGPMQFIPQSWRFFGRDGNGDGQVDPHNLYDAAAAAAELLCYVDGSLATDAGLRAALFSYNHHDAYVEAVLRAAAPFRSVVIPEPASGATAPPLLEVAG